MLLEMPERFLPQKMLISVIHKSVSEDMQIIVGEKRKKNSHNKDKCGNLVAITLCDPW